MARIAIIHIRDGADDITGFALPPGHTLVGLYEFPRRSELTCNGACVRKGSGAWSRHPDGFMKCSICGSRNRRLRRWITNALFDWLGANLLGNDAPALFRTPEEYGPRN